jgi:hypothetical protein
MLFAAIAMTAPALAQPPVDKQPPMEKPIQPPTANASECPEAVRGVQVKITNAPGGAAVTFSGKTQYLTDLRNIVHEAAAIVEYHTKLAAIHEEEVLSHVGERIPPVDVTAKDTPNGVKVMVKAVEPGDASAVFDRAKSFKKLWDENECVNGSHTET